MKNLKLYVGIILGCLLLTGCGASNKEYAVDSFESIQSSTNMDFGYTVESSVQSQSNTVKNDYNYSTDMEFKEESSSNIGSSSDDSISNPNLESNEVTTSNQKLIRKVSLKVTTVSFDDGLTSIKNKVKELGGYIESSEFIKDYRYRSNGNLRFQKMIIRIPSSKTDLFLDSVGTIGTIIENNDISTDVTLSYVETESKISALEIEYERLEELLKKADDLDTIIKLEDRLSNVRFELEKYKSTLRTMENLVTYSTISISLEEVRYEEVNEDNGSIGERIKSGLTNTLNELSVDLENGFVDLIVNLPYIILNLLNIGFGIFIFVIIIKRIKKSRRKHKRNEHTEKIIIDKNKDNGKE